MTRRLLLWGFQGTIDYRVSLTETEFDSLGLHAPPEDRELFISKNELEEWQRRLRLLGHGVSAAPGGSPLMSSLMAQAWLTSKQREVCSCFVGVRPQGLETMIGARQRETVRYACVEPQICSTLSLEYRRASAKLMLSVQEGRYLDESLAIRARKGMWDAIADAKPTLVGLGLGGLNKAKPSVACSIVRLLRRRARNSVVFVAGSSFARDLTADRAPAFWSDLNQLFASADVVSVSEGERRQLAAVWGDEWPAGLLTKGGTRLVVTHSATEVSVCSSPYLHANLDDCDAIIEEARAEASRHAAAALTGSGARFDGVLSAGILSEWHC